MEDLLYTLQKVIPAVAIGIVAAGLFALALHHRKTDRSELQRIARELGGTVAGGMAAGRYVRLLHSGLEQRITLCGGGEDGIPCVRFHQRSDLDFSLEIVRETAGGRAAQKRGLREDVQTGDPAFDREYRVRSDSPEKAVRFLESPERKRIVGQLFSKDFDRVTIRKGEVVIDLRSDSDEDQDPSRLKAWLEILSRFVSGSAAPSRLS